MSRPIPAWVGLSAAASFVRAIVAVAVGVALIPLGLGWSTEGDSFTDMLEAPVAGLGVILFGVVALGYAAREIHVYLRRRHLLADAPLVTGRVTHVQKEVPRSGPARLSVIVEFQHQGQTVTSAVSLSQKQQARIPFPPAPGDRALLAVDPRHAKRMEICAFERAA
jgi:hypothetical protein